MSATVPCRSVKPTQSSSTTGGKVVSTTTVAYPQAKWTLVLWWLLANAISFGIAGALFHNFPLAFIFPPTIVRLGAFYLSPGLAGVLFGAVPSILIGLFQWLILRGKFPVSRWWIFTVSAGVALDHFIADGFPNARDLSIAVVASSALVAVLQWLLLRRNLNPSLWWILATIVSWCLGWVLGVSVLGSLGLLQIPGQRGLDFQQHGLLGMVLGSVYGMATGVLMLLLLQAKGK